MKLRVSFPVKSQPATVTLAWFILTSWNDYNVVDVVVVLLLLFVCFCCVCVFFLLLFFLFCFWGEGYFPWYYFCTIFATTFFRCGGFLKVRMPAAYEPRGCALEDGDRIPCNRRSIKSYILTYSRVKEKTLTALGSRSYTALSLNVAADCIVLVDLLLFSFSFFFIVQTAALFIFRAFIHEKSA